MPILYPLAFVFTGTVSSGKSTTMDYLVHKHGLASIEEGARKIILEHKDKGINVRDDMRAFEQSTLQWQLDREAEMDPTHLTLLDRGVHDCMSFAEAAGVSLSWDGVVLKDRYRLIFSFDALPLEIDEIRDAFDVENNKKLGIMLDQLYRDYGYKVVRVPLAPMEERADFIMQKINETLGR